jgi:aldose 1-epimerase
MPEACVVELASGVMRLALRPDLGGCIAGFWHEGVAVLLSSEPSSLASPRPSGCFALVPCSNRVGQSRFTWRGEDFSLRANNGSSPHAIHGIGWERPWTVSGQSGAAATLQLVHTADGGWPFSFTATQRVELSGGGLRLTLDLLNTDTRAQPVGLGWHPYFPRRAQSRLQVEVAGQWGRGEDELPGQCTPATPLNAEVATLALDHCFEGWPGRARLSDEHFIVELTSSLRRVVVFTPADRPFYCVEPVSHVNNAVNSREPLARGLLELAPGESVQAWMNLAVTPPVSLPS